MVSLPLRRLVTVATELGEALLFSRLEGGDGLSQNGEYRVTVLSRRGDIHAVELLAKPVSVRLTTPHGRRREFNGLAAAFMQLGSRGRYHEYLIVVRPWTWMLTRTSDCRIFQDQTTRQILETVFADHPYADFRFELNASYSPWVYCVQYRETDFNFVARLMEQEGMHFFFSHQDGKHQLVISDGAQSHVPAPDYAEVAYLDPESGRSRQREGLRDWSHGSEIQPTRHAMRDYDFEKPRADLGVMAEAARPPGHDHADLFEIFDYPGEYRERAAGEVLARARIEELRQPYEWFRGEGNAAGLAPGGLFKLREHPRADQNQDYLVIGADYTIQESDYESGAPGGELFSLSLRAIPAAQEFRPLCLTPKPVVQGPQTAVVVGPKGDEIHTDPYGRIKVQFHWDRYGQGDPNSSCWVRVAQPWAGQQWGMIAIPRIGQEVVVEFLEGDPDRPLITGSVYNAMQMPPYALPEHMPRSGIKSRSSQGGSGANFNEIRFEDRKGAEELYFHAERDQTQYIKHDRVEWIGHQAHLSVENDRFEQCGGDQHLKVTGDQNVELGGSHSLQVGQDWQGKIGLKMAVDAGQEIHLKAGMKLVLEAGVQLSLKVGASFVDIGPAGVNISGPMVGINSGGSAGSGSGASPEAPQPPREATSSGAGQAAPALASPPPTTPLSPLAQALSVAREQMSAFVERCPG